ncbi:hypothetical protein QTP86_022211 [Hemibagrus guttatus]|nr:hypothetical protein QTP86_022211 [Hemibagrus guttatus]
MYSEIVTRSCALHKASDSTEMCENFRDSDLENRQNFEEKKHGWSGRISTGTLRYLGQPHGSSDFYLGVELELAENIKEVGIYEGQCYFDCKPGHGAFVAFSKLLLAWE